MKQNISVRTMSHLALLLALEIILARWLSINTAITRIGFAFVPLAVCAVLYGPVWTVALSVVADIMGSALFSSGWYPPITITALLTGLSYGLLLHHKRNPGLIHTTAAAAINNFILSLFVQSYWLSLLLGKGYTALVVSRIPQAVLLFCVQAALLPVVVKLAGTLDKQFGITMPSAGKA